MYGVLTPQGFPFFVTQGSTEPGIEDPKASKPVCEKEVLEILPALSQCRPQVHLESVLRSVGGMVISVTAARVHIPRKWCKEHDSPAFQKRKKGKTVFEIHENPFLAGQDQVPLHVVLAIAVLPDGEISSFFRSRHVGNVVKTMHDNNVVWR
jgi:hypothetical protein